MPIGLSALIGASAGSPGVVAPADLGREAATAAPAVAALYRALARPADRFVLADGQTLEVLPVPRFLGNPPVFDGLLEVTVLSEKANQQRKIARTDLASVIPFEEFALEQIDRFMSKGEGLPALDKLGATEKALRAVAWFHQGSRERPAVGPSPWNELGGRLQARLLAVRRERLGLLTEKAEKENSWSDALSLAEQLAEVYPEEGSMGRLLQSLWSRRGLASLRENDGVAARKWLTRIDSLYVHSPEAKPLREALHKRAEALAKEAAGLPGRPALDKLAEALQLWPRLPDARDDWLRQRKKYSVLYVGVGRLPEFLSPATAWTDVEKQAVDLLFEGLVQAGPAYEARLAAGMPEVRPLGRRVAIRRDAYWSDGERVNSADVRHTLQLMLQPQLQGRMSAWKELIEVPRVYEPSFQVAFNFRHGLFDPFPLLSFKLLPQHYRGKALEKADDADFARKPVGSGPFVYAGPMQEDGRTLAVFRANPNFVRGGLAGQPFIRELRFFTWSDPAKDTAFKPFRSALLIDVPGEHLSRLQALGINDIRTLTGRRVYFLGINDRVPALANTNLRRALAHALDRGQLLDRHFRGGHPELDLVETAGAALAIRLIPLRAGQGKWHRPVNGPFPPGSWAVCPAPRVPARLHDDGLARSFFRDAHKQTGPVKLTLKCACDDLRVVQACRDIAAQVEKTAAAAGAGLTLRVVPLSPHDLKHALEARDFDLAYCHLDYTQEIYDLWPLFDPQADATGAGGSNFLGYDNDGKLHSLFQAALSRRQFSAVQELAQAIHAHLFLHMPLIPLWQLDSHIAVPPGLQTVNLDPIRVFSHVAQWKLEP
jgi:ABC-type transport system substrate-binding protein